MFRSCSVQRSIVVNIECLHTPQLLFVTIIVILVVFDINIIIILVIATGCTQIPISTLSHIWVFVRLYGIVYVIIVIIIIIIMII